MRLNTAAPEIPLSWHAAADDLRLPLGEVHIWWVGLRIEGSDLCACWDLLSPEETRVASSHRFVKDLREFVVTRAVLRQILARYTGQSATDLRFESRPGGKPVLEGRQSPHFSVSHCSDLALLAVARFPIGIDVEHVRPGDFWQKVIGQCLSPRERAYLEALPARSRSTALYSLWTRKEAVLKALGTGLLYPPQQVCLLAESKKPTVVNLMGRNWLVQQVRAPRGYAASAAIEASAGKVKWRQCNYSVSALLGSSRRPVRDLEHVLAAQSTPMSALSI
jgi:4'-phosphopantetheinyl transferase